ELDQALSDHRRLATDGLTRNAFVSSSYSRNERFDGSFSYSNIGCDHLRKMVRLWFDHSDERYGFSVQKRKFLETGNTPGQYNEVAWIRFSHAVGWNRFEGGIIDDMGELLSMSVMSVLDTVEWFNYEELEWSEGASEGELVQPYGHLPVFSLLFPRARGISFGSLLTECKL
ncbi:MAG: GUN4 domain-containing protein, partial [Cyanobacteria bacterium P01_D01_bin.56]